MPAEVSDDFTQLVREMRAAMNAVDPTLQLTFDVMPGIENYDVAALVADDAADALFVMGYEYLTGSAAQTGSNAPLDKPEGQDLAGDVERILAQVPAGSRDPGPALVRTRLVHDQRRSRARTPAAARAGRSR